MDEVKKEAGEADAEHTFIRLARDCDSWFIDEFGIPCKNLYYKKQGADDDKDPRKIEDLKEI